MMERTLELSDGRTLSYTDCGPENAATVFYFHLFPSSRHEFELIRTRLEQSNLPIRVIVVLVWTAVIAVCLMVAIVAIGVITGNGMPNTTQSTAARDCSCSPCCQEPWQCQ
jgi:hypothetical protein